MIEVVLLPEVLPAFIKASRRPFAIWSRPSYSIRSPALRSDVSEQLINQALQISDLSHHPDSVRDSIEKDFARWRDGVDSDIESIFLHIWRFYRLDSCLHSTKHVRCVAFRASWLDGLCEFVGWGRGREIGNLLGSIFGGFSSVIMFSPSRAWQRFVLFCVEFRSSQRHVYVFLLNARCIAN